MVRRVSMALAVLAVMGAIAWIAEASENGPSAPGGPYVLMDRSGDYNACFYTAGYSWSIAADRPQAILFMTVVANAVASKMKINVDGALSKVSRAPPRDGSISQRAPAQ